MSKRALNRNTERQIAAWRRTAQPGDALNDGGGLHLRRQSLDTDSRGRDYWFLRFTSPETGKRGWLSVWGAPLPYPQATTEEARRRAQAIRETLAAKIDPLAARRRDGDAKRESDQEAERDEQRRLTFRQLFERWADTELTPHTRADGKRTGRKDGGQYSREQFERRIFPKLGNMAAAVVRKSDVLAILDAVKAEGKLRTCNVLLAELKQMMRFAVAREIISHSPLESVTKRDAGGAETERERVLSLAEMGTLAELLPKAGMHKRSELAVWIVLATGCRIGELMGAQWNHVDTAGGTWHLPDTKNERPHTIHLSAFAVRHFEALRALCEAESWVFPNSKGEDHVDVKTFGKQLADRQRPSDRRLQHRSKATASLALPGGRWTAHDLRRTAATLMAGLGVSGDVIDECLNHAIESRVRRTYIRDRRPAEQARAFDALGTRLDSIAKGSSDQAVRTPMNCAIPAS